MPSRFSIFWLCVVNADVAMICMQTMTALLYVAEDLNTTGSMNLLWIFVHTLTAMSLFSLAFLAYYIY